MSDDPRHTTGRTGEQLAAAHLERLGYAIVSRNHRTRFGELDLIAHDGETLVFCEVKTRRAGGDPWHSLGPRKQQQVRKMAAAYLAEATDRPFGAELRFDAIGVVLDAQDRLVRLDHIEAAF